MAHGGDLVYFQGPSSPGNYARAYRGSQRLFGAGMIGGSQRLFGAGMIGVNAGDLVAEVVHAPRMEEFIDLGDVNQLRSELGAGKALSEKRLLRSVVSP